MKISVICLRLIILQNFILCQSEIKAEIPIYCVEQNILKNTSAEIRKYLISAFSQLKYFYMAKLKCFA